MANFKPRIAMTKWISIPVALISGLPVGLAAGLFLASPFWTPLIDFVLTVAVGTTLVGLPQGVLAARVRRPSKRSGRLRLLLGMTLIGFTMSIVALMFVIPKMPHGVWERLPDPPEQAVGILGPKCTGFFPEIYLVSSSGRLFRYGDSEDGEDWTDAGSMESVLDSVMGECEHYDEFGTPSPPDQTVSLVHLEAQGVDCLSEVEYALLSNGQLWRWEYGSCAIGDFLVLFLSIALAVGAAAVAWGVHCEKLKLPDPDGHLFASESPNPRRDR